MGKPRIGTELKKPSDYTYDYPEQRVLAKKLRKGDLEIVARKTKRSYGYIAQMTSGKRRMTTDVRRIIESIIDFYQVLDEIL